MERPNYTFVRAYIATSRRCGNCSGKYGIDGVIHLAAKARGAARCRSVPRAYERHGHAVAARSCAGGIGTAIGRQAVLPHLKPSEVLQCAEPRVPAGCESGGGVSGGVTHRGIRSTTAQPLLQHRSSSDHFSTAYHDTYMQSTGLELSNNYGPLPSSRS